MGRLWKKLFWCFFLAMIPFVIPKNFKLHRPPIHIFLPISPRFLTNIGWWYFSLNIWVVYDQWELDWYVFDQNWAFTFSNFQILNATDKIIVYWLVFVHDNKLGMDNGQYMATWRLFGNCIKTTWKLKLLEDYWEITYRLFGGYLQTTWGPLCGPLGDHP